MSDEYLIFAVSFVFLIFLTFIFLFFLLPCLRYYFDKCHTRDVTRQLIDRQGNNFAVPEETGRDNRYNDIFFIEPNGPEAARIRTQLEKDDKDLPSYDEVMRMTNLSTPTAAPAADNFVPAMPSALSMAASSSSVNTTDTTLTVPPYTEANSNVRPLTPPPYTVEPIGASVVLPITTPLHSQQSS